MDALCLKLGPFCALAAVSQELASSAAWPVYFQCSSEDLGQMEDRSRVDDSALRLYQTCSIGTGKERKGVWEEGREMGYRFSAP